MSATKVSLLAFAVLCGLAAASAAGIKGQARDDSQQRAAGAPRGPLRPQQQQQYAAPGGQPGPAQQVPLGPRPGAQGLRGPGQVAPAFTGARAQQPLSGPAPAATPIQQQQQEQEQEPESDSLQQQQLQLQQQQQQQQQQQLQPQQQQEEVDPNAAAQDAAPALAAPAGAGAGAGAEEANPRPEPYAFQYAFEAGDSATSGSSQREEQQDASGRVTGFYTLKGEDGRDRRVDYIADATGFHATISTNEMGTAPKDSADVDWNAQSPTEAQVRAAESATQAARQRQLLNPQQPASQSLSSPRKNAGSLSAGSSQQQLLAAGKTNQHQQHQQHHQQQQQQQPQQQQQFTQQLQEPFEQIRQVELNARARKSRHAPFYLFTV